MVEINFYHLQKTSLERSLPRLLEKVYAIPNRCVVLLKSQDQLEEIDMLVWTYSQQSFLAHGCKGDKFAKHQPIWLTTVLENPNNASVLIVVEAETPLELNNFKKCLDLFNGYDEESVLFARQRWQEYKKQGHKLIYWFQSNQGSWNKKEDIEKI